MTTDQAAREPESVSRVRAAQERLADVDGLPVADHIDIYDGVHAELQDALAELDET